jgi:hypothetical protein
MYERPIPEKRRSNRSNVLLKATLETPSESLPVVLRNLSEEGALVRGFKLPEEGDHVLFHRQGLSVPSRVAWVCGGHAGIAFHFPLFPRELLRHVPDGSAEAPSILRKAPGVASRPLTSAERLLIQRWATDSAEASLD